MSANKFGKKKVFTCCAVVLVVLGGCSEDKDSERLDDPSMLRGDNLAPTQGYYPYDPALENVPRTASMVVHFGESVYQTEIVDTVRLAHRKTEGNMTYFVYEDLDIEYADRGRTLVITPKEMLEPQMEYGLWWKVASTTRATDFITEGDPNGAPEVQAENPDFFGVRQWGLYPGQAKPGSERTEIAKFSTINLRFSQPIDADTVSYGDGPNDNVWLENMQTGEFLEANIVVDGSMFVVDPVEDFEENARYALRFVDDEDPNAIKSTLGQSFNGNNYSYQLFYEIHDGFERNDEWPKTMNVSFASPGQTSRMGLVDRNSFGDWALDIQGNIPIDMEYETNSVIDIWSYSHFRMPLEALNQALAEQSGGGSEVRFLTDITGDIRYGTLDEYEDYADTVRLFANIGVTPDGGTEQQTYLELTGFVEPLEGDAFRVHVAGSVDPRDLGKPYAPGNGNVALQFDVRP